MSNTGNPFWPELPLAEWQNTYTTLHMCTQVVGKIKLMQSPHVNHWWQVVLYVNARGLTTSPIPYGTRTFEIDFDFMDHVLIVRTNDGGQRTFALAGNSVADFYRKLMDVLHSLEIYVKIWTKPVEVPERILFEEDHTHASYDSQHVQRLWQILVQTDRVLKQFRSGFIGKCSPVHFFWGAFDMAVTRFSGRAAPMHPGGVPALADFVVQEAYSHEVSSCGFWPGGGAVLEPAFYAYAYPEPTGFKEVSIIPEQAFYSAEMSEFILPYDAVRQSQNPDDMLLKFSQSTYEAAADLGNWDRKSLERNSPESGGKF
ncbi:DUF5996 family protein [Desulfomonile tiedjei]|uniref:Ava_C0101 and related proteins n=1 Tax=Desulfomonile tiedjei (strain ATCC 49306 / DSM 6799 / DCB-1) TaxID=706587 RepID=I4CD73_DESTA|nr:DUF5996 family protein [Desulfomonile tiedjei]AFM27514.1 hypothetical protein Desti_4900 [Desulfomonile tiedjei DSM 6799]